CRQEIVLDLLAGRRYASADKAHDVWIGVQAGQVVHIARGEAAEYQPLSFQENMHSYVHLTWVPQLM
ncbi:MAG: hypothetical protein WAK83_21525, partial [Trebonia sp.]|uniref:hypothetical protein n=1 Tax=Trebonia sp. TaxID=2767075 RepID=UPI003BAF86F8